uniref:AlNc14C29G2780 protein n=1 Tax=Albugo laibachii Nc14 TaxID=890382 RepID=F0W7H4_9STRA|nr:AlNc14C29G2780 [Albugo laibachii Nc14]|eukprot:CCA17075.1 AlNc14C29G2780 [Albugo laibachii Nc14]
MDAQSHSGTCPKVHVICGPNNYFVDYWVVGSPNFFAVGLMNCIFPKACTNVVVRKSNAHIVTEGIGGIFSQLPTINKPIGNDNSTKQTLPVTSVGMLEESRANLRLDIEHINQSDSGKNERKTEQICLYRPDPSSSSSCETCLHTKSGSGTSDPELLLQFCHHWKFCKGSTALLSSDLCKLSKYKVSSLRDQSSNMPQMNGAIMPDFMIFAFYNLGARLKDLYKNQLENIDKTKHCLTTIRMYNFTTHSLCCRCLAHKYNGMVVLDRFEAIHENDQKFTILLFRDEPVRLDLEVCSEDCGQIISIDDCMVDPIHVTKLTPTNNVVKWMLQTENTQLDNHVSSRSDSCFLIQYLLGEESKCPEIFPIKKILPLSPLSFLIFLSTISKLDHRWDARKKKFGCEYMELMPDIICDYESNRSKNNVDVNLNSNENEENKGYARANDVSDFGDVKVANVLVVEWDTKTSENFQKEAAFADCFICLTRKRKVVLISVNNRYAWMVDAGSFPSCKTCDQKVTFGPQFPYHQYLIPVSAAIKMMKTLETKEKRPRPDETELGDAFDRAPKQAPGRLQACENPPDATLLTSSSKHPDAVFTTLLSPNKTLFLQPQDTGIVSSFKSQISKLQHRYVADHFVDVLRRNLDTGDDCVEKCIDSLFDVNVFVAMCVAETAWSKIFVEVIDELVESFDKPRAISISVLQLKVSVTIQATFITVYAPTRKDIKLKKKISVTL